MKGDAFDIKRIQDAVVALLGDALDGSTEADVRVLVRLVAEHRAYLDISDDSQKEGSRYESESAFSGLNSYLSVSALRRVLRDQNSVQIDWETLSPRQLRLEFVKLFDELLGTASESRALGILINLYRLQLVGAVVAYETD